MPGSFFDTDVLLSVASGDSTKADRAERLIGAGGIISVQVLNEIANVVRRKMDGHVMDPNPRISVGHPLLASGADAYDRGSRNGAGGRRALRIVGLRRDDRRLGAARRLQDGVVLEGRLRVINRFRAENAT
jgi:hypothetical protein